MTWLIKYQKTYHEWLVKLGGCPIMLIVRILVYCQYVSVRDFVSTISEKELIFNLFVINLKDVKNKKSN